MVDFLIKQDSAVLTHIWIKNQQFFIVFLKHPLSSEHKDSSIQMKITLECVSKFCNDHDFKVIGIYPNTDPGSYDIIEEIEKYSKNSQFYFFKNLQGIEFEFCVKQTSTIHVIACAVLINVMSMAPYIKYS